MSQPLFTPEAFAAKAREVIAEGCVLLRNENAALPLLPGSSIAVFGRTQMNYFKSGLGSGGLVNTRYVTGIYEALERDGDYTLDAQTRKLYEQWIVGHPFEMGDGWANHPWFQQEMPLEDAAVADAAGRCGAAPAVFCVGGKEDRAPG